MRQDSAPLPPSQHLVPLSLQFLLIFRKAAAGELQEDSGLHVLARLSEIDVSTEGVKGAKSFFEAKVRSQLPCGPSSRTRGPGSALGVTVPLLVPVQAARTLTPGL